MPRYDNDRTNDVNPNSECGSFHEDNERKYEDVRIWILSNIVAIRVLSVLISARVIWHK